MSRSINKESRGASFKKITANPEVHKGLTIANLSDVELGTAEIREDSNWIDFRGKTVPRLTFIFTEKVLTKDKEEGMYFKSYTAFPDLYNADKEWQWDNMSQTIKHFIDVLSGSDFKDEYSELLDLKMDEGKEYEIDDQIKAWKSFFEGVVKVFKGDKKAGLPVLIDKVVWLKLILDVKGKKVNNGDYGIPLFPGDGIVELYKEGVTASIRINISKGENIVPRTYEEPTELGVAATGVGAADGGARPAFMK